jgi:hypothetical protein
VGSVRLRGLALAILLAPTPGAAAQQSRGTVAGTIRDSAGGAVVRAEVVLEASGARTLTDARGAYRLHAVPAGPAHLHVRRLGFRPATLSIDVATAGVTEADVRLNPVPLRLASVEVRERREVYDARLSGFNQRRARKGGWSARTPSGLPTFSARCRAFESETPVAAALEWCASGAPGAPRLSSSTAFPRVPGSSTST